MQMWCSFKKWLSRLVAYAYYVKADNDQLEVYFKASIFPAKKRCVVSYRCIRAVYASQLEFGTCLELFLKDKRKLYLQTSVFLDGNLDVKNWDFLINTLACNLAGFNMNNFTESEQVLEVPFLCWEADKKVPDLQVVTEANQIRIIWKETGDKYCTEDYLKLTTESKAI